jgi:hypothetical protein
MTFLTDMPVLYDVGVNTSLLDAPLEPPVVPKVPRAYWRTPRRKLSTSSLPNLWSLEWEQERQEREEQERKELERKKQERQYQEWYESEEAVSRRCRDAVFAASCHWIMEDDIPGLAAPVYRYYHSEVKGMLAAVAAANMPLTPIQKAWRDHVDALQELDGIVVKTPEQIARLVVLDSQTVDIRAAWKAEEQEC